MIGTEKDLKSALFALVNKKPIRLLENTEYACNCNQIKTYDGKKIKTNGLAIALDSIILDKIAVAYKSVRGLQTYYASFILNDEEAGVLINGSTYTTTDNIGEDIGILVPTATMLIGESYACQQAFTDIQDVILHNSSYQEDDELCLRIYNDICRFCDDGYTYLKDAGQMKIQLLEGGVDLERVKKPIETNILVLMDEFKPYVSKGKAKAVHKEEEEETPVEYDKDFIINYNAWNESQKLNIPHGELNSYVMTKQAESIARKIKYRMDKVNESIELGATGIDAIGNNYINLLLVGEPGTGKTKMCYAIADMVKMPIYTIPISKNTEEDTFEGKNKVINGQISYAETDFIKAYENGGIIVLEEINLADPAVIMGSLGQAIEFPFVVMKDGYIPIRRHPMCIIIATMNTGTNGSKGLNQALSSRFKQSYILADQPKDVFINILKSKFPKNKKDCIWTAKAYNRVKDFLLTPEINREDLSHNISMRACFGVLENIEEGEERKTAVVNTIVGKIAESDIEIARAVENKVISSLPD